MKCVATQEQYATIWVRECLSVYPEVDAFEKLVGFSVDRDWLNQTAAVLNCPVKVNPPNWQHGRIIYSALRRYLTSHPELARYPGNCALLDIGTAKGFSACVMARALADHTMPFIPVYTVDMIEPLSRESRNSIAEVDGPKTLHEILSPFLPNGITVECFGGGSRKVLMDLRGGNYRIPFAFVDGKHSFNDVRFEAMELASRQDSGDVVIFDDCQIPDVKRAVITVSPGLYSVQYLQSGPRLYAIASRK